MANTNNTILELHWYGEKSADHPDREPDDAWLILEDEDSNEINSVPGMREWQLNSGSWTPVGRSSDRELDGGYNHTLRLEIDN